MRISNTSVPQKAVTMKYHLWSTVSTTRITTSCTDTKSR